MNKRNKLIAQATLILLVLAFSAFKFFGPQINLSGENNSTCEFSNRIHANDLIYVEHAKCRMRCREIDKSLVEEVYLNGTVNCKKSTVNKGNNRYALEAKDNRGDMIRVIIEDDNGKHVVITAIRLDRSDKCSCS